MSCSEGVKRFAGAKARCPVASQLSRQNDPGWVVTSFWRLIFAVDIATFWVAAILLITAQPTLAVNARLAVQLTLIAH